ncbi:MAG: T9SS type A sorting domain-containing protein [Bacteroidetes bacterium]|nr:T9SS type A sorting domain-containing protein [Bacteroidota bacterium]
MKSKVSSLTIALFILCTIQSNAQTTAMNFNRNDCNGNPHNLFNDLNSGQVVILEYFMTSCSACPAAGQTLESLKANLLTQYPGKIKSYAIAFNNTYSCATVKNWVTSNGFTSFPMDSGATQVAYYGGMGMPTIVIAGGATHQLLGSPYIGFSTNDTTQMAANIRNFLGTQVGIKENSSLITKIKIYPNPASTEAKIEFYLQTEGDVKVEILDITGKMISIVINEKAPSGQYTRMLSLQALPVGNYTVKFTANDFTATRKLNIVK